jgi:AraC-like DNA-binding protein
MSAISCSVGRWPARSLIRIIERNRIVISCGVCWRALTDIAGRALVMATNEPRPDRHRSNFCGVIDVVRETGFGHASHMARCMRRVLGLSPSQIAGASR